MKKSLVAVLICSIGLNAIAATNELLTWEECLARAENNSPELAAARAAIRELEYGVASASSGFLPQISASAGVNRGERENAAGWNKTESASADLTLSQDLFSGMGNVAKRKRALAQLQIGNEQYRQARSDVELRLRLAFIEVLYAQDLIDLTKKIEERRRNNVRLIQLRFDGGRENAGSLARSKAQLSEASFEVRQAERSLAYALRNLAAAMGSMEPDQGAVGVLKADAPEELTELLSLMKQTPDYEIATTQIEATEEGMRVTRSDRFPQISFNASTGLSGDNYPEYGDWSVGLRASMPLFTGNRLRSEVAAAKEKIVQSELDLLDTGNTLMASLQQRWNNYQDAIENEATQKELFDAETLRAEISTAKYRQGLLSYEDWDIIESNLITQGKTHLQRRRTSEIEQARWKNALGWSEWHTTGEQ
ncbi:MAG: TolC family protein [Kiritimatiellales bacterium]|nr:TolC family protein [Kiritimatiellales bacterium]